MQAKQLSFFKIVMMCLLMLAPNFVRAEPIEKPLPSCVHWTSSFAFIEFLSEGRISTNLEGGANLYKANPQLCSVHELRMGKECSPVTFLKNGDRVRIAHQCGPWTRVQKEGRKGKKRVSGWVSSENISILPISREDVLNRQKWNRASSDDPVLLNAIQQKNNEEVIKFLLTSGNEGKIQKALGFAIFADNPHIVQFALDHGANPNNAPEPCIYSSAITRNIEIAQSLIKAGWNLNCQSNGDQTTPLMFLAMQRRGDTTTQTTGIFTYPYSEPAEVAKLLIEHDANFEARNVWGETALRVTIEVNNVDVAEALLELGADPNNYLDNSNSIGMQKGYTTLMNALSWYELTWDPTMISLLLKYRADVNYRDPSPYDADCDNTTKGKCTFLGQTALTRAAKDGYLTVVAILLRSGADPLISRTDGKLPEEIARHNGHLDIARLIKNSTHSVDGGSDGSSR